MEPGITYISSVKLEDTLNLTDPKAMYEGWDLEVIEGENPTIFTKSYPWNIAPVGAEAMIPEGDQYWEYGDTVDFFITPPNDGIIGIITQDANSEQPDIYIDPTAILYCVKNYRLKIGTESFDYGIKLIDTETNKITLWENLNESKTAYSPIYIRRYIIDDWPVYNAEVQRYAMLTSGASFLPVGYSLTIVYNHKSTPTSSYTRHFGFCYYY